MLELDNMNLPINSPAKGFEEIKQINEFGVEFWSARDLYHVLNYSSWQMFIKLLERAMKSCENSGQKIENHFNRSIKMVA